MPTIRKIFHQTASPTRLPPGRLLAEMATETYARLAATDTVANLREQIFIIQQDGSSATLLHPDPAQNLLSLVAGTRNLHNELDESAKSGRTFCYFDEMKTEKRFLVINTSGKSELIHPDRDLMHAFDHELAHATIRDGLYVSKATAADANLGECIADAYAALRLYQRCGNAAADIRDLIEARTLHLVFDDAQTHFTAPVLERIIEQSEIIDYAALLPRETMDLARRLALLHAPNPGVTERLANSFAGFLKGAAPERSDSLLPFAEAVLKTPFPPVFLYGSTALSALLSGQIEWNKRPVRLEGPAWDAVREKLATRMAAYQTEGDLFGLRLPKRPAPMRRGP